MKTKKSVIAGLALALTIGVIYTGCEKKKLEIDTDTSSASDNLTSESAMSDVFSTVNEHSDSIENFRSSCATLTIDTTIGTGYPKTITIDYGVNGCGIGDKKGTITAVFSGPFRDSGSVIVITYNNFYINSRQLTADGDTIKNLGSTSGNIKYKVIVKNAKLVSSSETISWSSVKTIEWSEGSLTKTTADDVFLMSGSTTGVSAKGIAYKSRITTPLKKSAACDYIESGVLELTPDGKDTRVINFGTTGCDNDATVTVNGVVRDINL